VLDDDPTLDPDPALVPELGPLPPSCKLVVDPDATGASSDAPPSFDAALVAALPHPTASMQDTTAPPAIRMFIIEVSRVLEQPRRLRATRRPTQRRRAPTLAV